jgi:hypothetical protein
VCAVLGQQVFYTSQGSRGYMQGVDSSGWGHHRPTDDFVSNSVSIGIHGQYRDPIEHRQSACRSVGIAHTCFVNHQLGSDHVVQRSLFVHPTLCLLLEYRSGRDRTRPCGCVTDDRCFDVDSVHFSMLSQRTTRINRRRQVDLPHRRTQPPLDCIRLFCLLSSKRSVFADTLERFHSSRRGRSSHHGIAETGTRQVSRQRQDLEG